MTGEELRALQAPLKARYRAQPDTARIVLRAGASLDEGVSCSVETGRQLVQAGLHPASGGSGELACSGDMLLQALAACAGVTLRAVATALDLPVRGGRVTAEGDLDVRGTLGVERHATVGFSRIRLHFDLEGETTPEQEQKLLSLTERYCVVLQTLRRGTEVVLA